MVGPATVNGRGPGRYRRTTVGPSAGGGSECRSLSVSPIPEDSHRAAYDIRFNRAWFGCGALAWALRRWRSAAKWHRGIAPFGVAVPECRKGASPPPPHLIA